MSCLIVQVGSRPTHVVTLDGGGDVTIGRAAGSPILVDDAALADVHVSITAEDGGGVARLVVLGPPGLVRVNGESVDDERVLLDRDVVRVGGQARVVFRAGDPPTPEEEAGPLPEGVTLLAAQVRAMVWLSASRALVTAEPRPRLPHIVAATERALTSVAMRLGGVDTSSWPREIANELVGENVLAAAASDLFVRSFTATPTLLVADRGSGERPVCMISGRDALDVLIERWTGVPRGELRRDLRVGGFRVQLEDDPRTVRAVRVTHFPALEDVAPLPPARR